MGAALQASGIPRSQLFVTSKVHPNDLGFNSTMKVWGGMDWNWNCGGGAWEGRRVALGGQRGGSRWTGLLHVICCSREFAWTSCG